MKRGRWVTGIWMVMLSGAVLLTGASAFAGSPIWAPPVLDDLIAEGIANNQSISSMRQEIAAMADQVPVAGTLPDPMLGVGLLNLPTNSFSFDQEPMTQKQISLEQQVPWPGKLSLKSKMAAQAVGSKEALLKAEILALSQKIAEAWYELGYVEKSLQNNARLTDLVNQIKREAQDRYAVGRGLQNNIFQSEMELSKLSTERIMLENQQRTIQDRLNMMLNRNPYQPVAPAGRTGGQTSRFFAARGQERGPSIQSGTGRQAVRNFPGRNSRRTGQKGLPAGHGIQACLRPAG